MSTSEEQKLGAGFREGKRASSMFYEYVRLPNADVLNTIATALYLKADSKEKLLSDERYGADSEPKILTHDDKESIFMSLWAHRYETISLAHIEMAAAYADVSKKDVVKFITDEIMTGKVNFVRCQCSRSFASLNGGEICPVCKLVNK